MMTRSGGFDFGCASLGAVLLKPNVQQPTPNVSKKSGALLPLAALLLGLVLLNGCATGNSDMPWNSPQPWEGSPNIPGFQRE